MAADGIVQPATYELPLHVRGELVSKQPSEGDGAPLSERLLVRNALWFCRLRWVVITILGGSAILGLFPDLLRATGLRMPARWLLGMACVLAVYNLIFLRHARALQKRAQRLPLAINLWGQIVLDLIILTAVVHFVGSSETYIAFAYLFHIVLACIFFSRSQSFAVTALACALYIVCITTEEMGIVPSSSSIYALPLPERHAELAPASSVLNPASAVGIWVVVWYLTSHLSTTVRKRDSALAKANRRLIRAQAERTRHMLRTTHELKAPFAAIHANTQRLFRGRCGPLPERAIAVVGRIAARCRKLTNEIQEMLQLANLSSTGQQPPPHVELDLADLLRRCVAQVELTAAQRGIVLEEDLLPVDVRGVEDHLKMLFSNLLSNAITYSHEGGHVRIRCRSNQDSKFVVAIADDGIGIPADKLPHIFDEHYRTKEAAQHNKQSSGLGLAIVRQVARMHGIRVCVTSRPGAGTTFELRLSPGGIQETMKMKETQDGLRDDRRR